MHGTGDVLKWLGRLSLHRPAREMLIFSKWLHRNKNPHRRDKAYQKLNRVKKDFEGYYKQELHVQVVHTVKQALSSSEPNSNSLDPDSCSSTILPSLLDRLASCIVYVGRYLEFMESTFKDLMERINIGHNIPTYAVILASLSRIWFYMRLHIWSLAESYLHISGLLPLPYIPKDPLHVIISEDYHRYFPAHMRINNDGKLLTAVVEDASDNVMLGSKVMEARQRDFELPSLGPTPNPSSVNCMKGQQRLRKIPAVFKISLSRHRKNWLFYVYNKKITKILERYKVLVGHRTVLSVAYIRATRDYSLFGNRVKRIRLKIKMKKCAKHKRHWHRRKKVWSMHTSLPPITVSSHKSSDNHVTSKSYDISTVSGGMLFDDSHLSKDNQTIDDIFSLIDH